MVRHRRFTCKRKFGITKTSSSAEERLSPEHSDFDDEEEMKKGSYTHTASKSTSYEGDIAVTYGRLFGGKHMINAVGGFNFSLSKETSNGYKRSASRKMLSGVLPLPMVIPKTGNRPTRKAKHVPPVFI